MIYPATYAWKGKRPDICPVVNALWNSADTIPIPDLIGDQSVLLQIRDYAPEHD
jgi:hypothetical protein